MIELAGVTKTFHSGAANRFTAVQDVSLAVARGRMTVLKGPSGSGKTTLLTLIGCMARPTAGRIVLRGVPAGCVPGLDAGGELEVGGLPERFLTGIRRAVFGFIFQQFNLVKRISVLENVILPAFPTGEPAGPVRARGRALLERLSIARHASAPVDRLSGGEMQRVAIARALINDPSVIVADEPTAHLDSRLSREVLDILGSFKAQGKTLLVASHDPIVCESLMVDTVVEMRDGTITGAGPAH